ncbi:hypothetical protein HYE68_003044 [Fusarium pseudograminearum]|nr:hypothetical protein HYE68_003044 [Fusarium pseudograminearum]
MPPRPAAIKEARPTMRLKNQDGTYKETQEADVFGASGGKLEDLLDDERWLYTESRRKTQAYPLSDLFARTVFKPNNSKTRANHAIWNPGPYSPRYSTTSTRSPTSPHMAFKLVARACNVNEGETGQDMKDVREHVGMGPSTRTTINTDIEAIYVGICAIDCLPVLLCKDVDQDSKITNTDSLDAFTLLNVDNDTNDSGKSVIWLENMLIPGNIAHVKSALNNELHGVAKTLPSNESEVRKPALCRPIHVGQDYDKLHFRMRWPPMAALEFPPGMIKAMETFLSAHPFDNVPLNIALAATIIYLDLVDESWPSEAFVTHQVPIHAPHLGRFILYFSHMLRYVEIKHLTEFIHPARFATKHYYTDTVGSSDSIISTTLISAKEMRKWYSQVRSRYPQLSKTHRFTLIPASMPGTHMVFPQDCSSAEPPSLDLFRICCLNDIRTLGLPSYHNIDPKRGSFRYIAGPDWLFSRNLKRPTHSMYDYFAEDYWKPKPDTRFMVLTGQAKQIDVLFPDITSDYYTDNKDITAFVERRFGVTTERPAKRPRISAPTLGAAAKVKIETLMASAPALSRDWDTLTVCLENEEPSIQEARQLLSKVHPFIASAEVLHANASEGKGSLKDVLRIVYRAVGLDPQLALIRHEKNWTSQKSVFSQFGQSVEQAIKDITALKPLEDGLRYALPYVEILGKSTLIQDQIRIYKEIKALLDEEA